MIWTVTKETGRTAKFVTDMATVKFSKEKGTWTGTGELFDDSAKNAKDIDTHLVDLQATLSGCYAATANL